MNCSISRLKVIRVKLLDLNFFPSNSHNLDYHKDDEDGQILRGKPSF